jgi:hypothetical protein
MLGAAPLEAAIMCSDVKSEQVLTFVVSVRIAQGYSSLENSVKSLWRGAGELSYLWPRGCGQNGGVDLPHRNMD